MTKTGPGGIPWCLEFHGVSSMEFHGVSIQNRYSFELFIIKMSLLEFK
jgi:hypothetical protein